VGDRVRVLAVIDSLGVGGAEALLPTFLQHVDRDRFDVRVLALDAAPPNHVQEAVRANCTELVQWDGRRLLSRGRVNELSQVIRDWQIDVIHSHLLYSNVQAALAGKRTQTPVLATLHNIYPSRQRYSSVAKRLIEVQVMRVAGVHCIAVAEEVRRAYCGVLGLPIARVSVLPNAVDLGRFMNPRPDMVTHTREHVLAGAEGPLVIAVGRIDAQKGFCDLVQAAATLRERFPNGRVVIAGRPGEDAEHVEREIARLGLGDYVRLLGQRDDVPLLLAAADVWVMSSHWEGAPISLLEAMAAGTPVVATRVGGIPEVVCDGENGLLVSPYEPAALATAIERILADRELADRLATAGLETVQEYGAERWARRIEDVYLRLLAGAPVGVMVRAA
jgi:L-malate glycosyltransferase